MRFHLAQYAYANPAPAIADQLPSSVHIARNAMFRKKRIYPPRRSYRFLLAVTPPCMQGRSSKKERKLFHKLEFYEYGGLGGNGKKRRGVFRSTTRLVVFFGINKVFGAESTDTAKNRAFLEIGRTERRERNGRQCGLHGRLRRSCSRSPAVPETVIRRALPARCEDETSTSPHTPPVGASARIRGTTIEKNYRPPAPSAPAMSVRSAGVSSESTLPTTGATMPSPSEYPLRT